MTMKIRTVLILHISGLPHTQGIQENSGNFQVVENLGKLRETQGNSRNFYSFFLTQGISGKF